MFLVVVEWVVAVIVVWLWSVVVDGQCLVGVGLSLFAVPSSLGCKW